MYELLGLKATVRKDGTLDVSGTFGLREARLGGEPTSIWKAVTGEGLEIPPPDDPYWDEEDRCSDRRAPRRTPIMTTARVPFRAMLPPHGGQDRVPQANGANVGVGAWARADVSRDIARTDLPRHIARRLARIEVYVSPEGPVC